MSSVDLFVRHFLAIYFLMIGLHYTSRSLGLFERMRFSHIHYGVRGSGPWLGRFGDMFQAPILVAGVVLLLASFSLIDYVQAYMHKDWRTGIDEKQQGELITTGPFRRSRNPLFMAIMLGQVGFFLALPSVFSLVCLVVGMVVIVRQARAEEHALSRLYGDDYSAYLARVPRWF